MGWGLQSAGAGPCSWLVGWYQLRSHGFQPWGEKDHVLWLCCSWSVSGLTPWHRVEPMDVPRDLFCIDTGSALGQVAA